MQQSAFTLQNRSTADDRLEFLYINLVGQLVRVHTIDGAVTEGLFLSRLDDDEPTQTEDQGSKGQTGGVILRHHRQCQSTRHSLDQSAELQEEDLLFYYSDILYLDVANLKIRTSTPGAGQVQGYRGCHDLEKLDWTDRGRDELLESDISGGGEPAFDQFAANAKFGVTSTYSEEKYTTRLNRSEFSQAEIKRAEVLAQEIEGSTPTHGIAHQLDRGGVLDTVGEGTLFSDVARPAAMEAETGSATNRGKVNKSAAAPVGPRVKPGNAAQPGLGNGKASAGRSVPAAADASIPASPQEPASPSADLNLHARPYTPLRNFEDFIKSIATAIASNPECYDCPSCWPGDDKVGAGSNPIPIEQANAGMPYTGPYGTGPAFPMGQGGMHHQFPHPMGSMTAPHQQSYAPQHPSMNYNPAMTPPPPPAMAMGGPHSMGMGGHAGLGGGGYGGSHRAMGGHAGGGSYGGGNYSGMDPAMMNSGGMGPPMSSGGGPSGGAGRQSLGGGGRPPKTSQPQQPVAVTSQGGSSSSGPASNAVPPPPSAAGPLPNVDSNGTSGAAEPAAAPAGRGGGTQSNPSPGPSQRKMRRGGGGAAAGEKKGK